MTSSAVRVPLSLLLTCLACASCSEQKQQHDPSQDAVSFHAVVDGMIHKEGGLLEITERQAREVHELLEVGLEEGRFGQRAKRALEELPHDVAISGLLKSVAKLDAPDTLRFSAYQALLFHTKTPQPAIVPRLVLRLKYEKDLESNLLITELLLRHGNGAGLDALHTILANESLAEDLRFKASALLAAVPGVDDNQDFPSQWASFLEVLGRWHERRSLLASDEALGTDLDSHLAVEIGRMMAQFRSQPLRPVDDARFVMTRLKAQHSVPALVEAAFDSDAYIREHALQSLAWMGYPVGHWRRSADFPYLERLAPLLDHPAMRPRTLEALAADGGPEAAALIAPHTLAGSPDTRTAACDGLLQTADLNQISLAREAAKQPFLSPEARLSLHLLIALTDTLPPAAPSASEIPEGERQRRTQWAEQRKRRPAASGN